MATAIDTLFLEIGLDASKFEKSARDLEKTNKGVEKSLKDTEKSAGVTGKEIANLSKQVTGGSKALGGLIDVLAGVGKGLAVVTAVIAGGAGMVELARETAQANQELDNMSKNLNMSSQSLSSWRGAAQMAGGSAQGMSSFLNTLSGNMTRLTMMGDTSSLPYFNALGVAMLDASGKARPLNNIMLDLADKFSGMDRQQAYNMAKMMGIDDGTFNLLVQGRQEVEKMLAMQAKLYHSNKQDIENSRKLSMAYSYMGQQLDSLKLMIGNAILPLAIKMAEAVTGFLDYLMAHENLVKGVFMGLAGVISVMLLPALASATAAVFGFIAPFMPAIAVVVALAGAFGLLYEDYQVWAAGGRSLFDWGKFNDYIRNSHVSVKSLAEGFLYLNTGYRTWADAGNAAFDWLRQKGFIDDNTVSVHSLINGFKNLAAELKDDLMPYLYDLFDVFSSLKNGDFNGAWDALKRGASRGFDAAKGLFTEKVQRAGGAVDIVTGQAVGTSLAGTPFAGGVGGKISKGKMTSFGGKIDGFSDAESLAFANAVMARENKAGNLGTVNQYGYTGLYQFGAEALAATGYIDPRKLPSRRFMTLWSDKKHKYVFNGEEHKAFLANPSNWLKGNWEEYKRSKPMQDDSFAKNVNLNLKAGKSLHRGDKVKMAGYAMAAHLKGAGNANKWYSRGIDSKDGNGTRTSDYAATGERAMMAAISSDVQRNSYAATNFVHHAAAAQAANITNNNHSTANVSINGGIHVQSSSPTISGTMADASHAAHQRMGLLAVGAIR